MMLERRDLLAGGVLAIAVTAIGGWDLRAGPQKSAVPSGLIPADRAALILHRGDLAALDFLRDMRAAAPHSRISDYAVGVLVPQGFARTGALLDGARGQAVIAWLDDGAAVAVEALLQARGAIAFSRQRFRGQALLTARI